MMAGGSVMKISCVSLTVVASEASLSKSKWS